MMNCLSLSHEPEDYRGAVWVRSSTHPGVRFAVNRISFGRRLALATAIREAGRRLEFASAGEGLADKAERCIAEMEIERIYLRCGLAGVEGLDVEGGPACADVLFDNGPEDLTREILAAIKSEWYLPDEERKN